MNCEHSDVECINQYELIRKYRCNLCGTIMMCSCDREFAEKYLPHQLSHGVLSQNQERIPVTDGFVDNVCSECRGEPLIAAPKSESYGRSSKIRRYYWREIFFDTVKAVEKKTDDDPMPHKNPMLWKEVEKGIVKNWRERHEHNPKYTYSEMSQEEIIKKFGVDVEMVYAPHENGVDRKVLIRDGSNLVTAEEYAKEYYQKRGYRVISAESVPFHVIFGVFMYPILMDSEDDKTGIISFGSRKSGDNYVDSDKLLTKTILPSDFGTEGYYTRRESAILSHIEGLEDTNWLFDYLLEQSSSLREYLWAHKKEDISRAKEIVSIISEEDLKRILKYLSANYWKNFCGWPDFLICNEAGIHFIEVKSSKDKLSQDQKNWIKGNYEFLNFKFSIFKISKPRE